MGVYGEYEIVITYDFQKIMSEEEAIKTTEKIEKSYHNVCRNERHIPVQGILFHNYLIELSVLVEIKMIREATPRYTMGHPVPPPKYCLSVKSMDKCKAESAIDKIEKLLKKEE